MTLSRMPRLLLILAVVAVAFVAAPALRTASAVDLQSARADLEELKKSTKPKFGNEDIDQYLRAVLTAFKELDMPGEGADPAAVAKATKERDKFRADAEKEILKVLVLTRVENDINQRNEVNTKAAEILGEMAPFLDEKGRKDLSKKIQQAIEKKIMKFKHEVSTDHLEATFGALGKLNDSSTLEWLLKNFTHTKEHEKMYLVAAHKAMVLFTNVPGKMRFEICDVFVKNYAGVESQAEQSSNDPKVLAKKRFWDDIKTGVVPVMQYYTKDPIEGSPASNAEGQALAKMAEFQDWMRDHRSLRKAPWVDPEIKKDGDS